MTEDWRGFCVDVTEPAELNEVLTSALYLDTFLSLPFVPMLNKHNRGYTVINAASGRW